MPTPQPLPAIGRIITFIAPEDGLPFTGRVLRDYGFAVAVAAISLKATLPISVLAAGQPYTVIPSGA